MTPELMERLTCAKFLFLNGIEALTHPSPQAAALALLSFQDAVEMVLGAVADDRHAKPSKDFMDLMAQMQMVALHLRRLQVIPFTLCAAAPAR